MALIGFFVAALIVRNWDLQTYGFLIIIRSFLLVGTMGLLDPSLSEIATIAIAKARARNRWQHARQTIIILYALAVLISILSFVIVYLSSEFLIEFLNIETSMIDPARQIILASIASNFISFPSRVSEGVIVGFEKYLFKRLIDLSASVMFLIFVLFAIQYNKSFIFLAMTYILCNTLRSLVMMLYSIGAAREYINKTDFRISLMKQVFKRSIILTQNKFLGSVPQFITPLLISSIAGPMAVGIYDLSLRLPRLMKMALGLIPSALLPVIPRLRLATYRDKAEILTKFGYSVVPAITMPVIVLLAASSSKILGVWLGPEMAQFWHWSVVGFIPVIVSQFSLLPAMNLVDRPAAYVKNNKISALQTLLALTAGSALCIFYGAFGFIFANAASNLFFFEQKYRNISEALGVDYNKCKKKAFIIATPNIFLLSLMLVFQNNLNALPFPTYSFVLILILITCTLATFFWVLESDERKLLKNIALQGVWRKLG